MVQKDSIKVSSQFFFNLDINSLHYNNKRCPTKYVFSVLKIVATTKTIGNIAKNYNFVLIFLSLLIFSSLMPSYNF